MRLASLQTASAQSLPWLLGLAVLALTGISLIGYDAGRALLLFPALTLVAFASLPWLRVPKASYGLYTLLAMGAFLAAILAGTALFHPQLITLSFCRAFIMLALPFVLLLAALLCPQAFKNNKPLLWAFAAFEAVLVAQIFYSYFSGWGEVHDLRNGIRRAFGVAGDSFTPLLSFFALLNVLRGRMWRFVLCMIALFMSGGKLAIGMVLLGLIATLPLLPRGREARLRTASYIAISLVLGFYIALPSVRTGLFAAPSIVSSPLETNAAPVPANVTKIAAAPAQPPVPTSTTTPARSPVSPYTEKLEPDIVVRLIIASGLGRIITIGAAADIFRNHPLAGVGYNQSGNPEIFGPAVRADFFGLQYRYNILPVRLTAEKFIGNQFAQIAAEQGIIGLVPFVLFCICGLFLICSTYKHMLRRTLKTDNDKLAAASAIWLFLMLLINQTAPWLVSGSVLTVWVALTLALCASQQDEPA